MKGIPIFIPLKMPTRKNSTRAPFVGQLAAMGRALSRISPALVFLSLGLLLAPSFYSNDWLWQHPVPQGNTIRAAAPGPEFLIAVGDYGTIVRFHNKTKTWQHVATPTQQHLKAIAMVSATDLVAAGTEGTILRSSDSGLNWTLEQSGTKEILYGLAFGSPEAGIAAGSSGTILITHDGGHSWAPRSADVKFTLRAITFLSSHDAVAIGESGIILKTSDAGINWKKQQVSGNLLSIVSRGDHLIAVGGEAGYFWNKRVIFHSSDRGESWKSEVNESGPVLYGVSLGPNLAAVACGESGTLLQTTGQNSPWTKTKSPVKHLLAAVVHVEEAIMALGSFGIVVTSSDSGKSWTANFADKQKELYSISFFDSDHGVAVGEEGRILYTVDGGMLWQLSKSDYKAFLFGVSMMSPVAAVAVGGEGLVLRTTNGGETWKAIVAGTDVYLHAVEFIDDHAGVAVGYSALMTTGDGGVTWERKPIPPGVGDCMLMDVAYASQSDVAAVGSTGIVLTSSDGGRNWIQRQSGTTQNLQSIAWSDAHHATVVGDKGIILCTADGGHTWVEIASGTDQRLSGVAYLNSREGFTGGENGILLSTTDGGRTWARERSHTLNHLRGLFCRAGTPVFAAGWNGTILRRDFSRPLKIQ